MRRGGKVHDNQPVVFPFKRRVKRIKRLPSSRAVPHARGFELHAVGIGPETCESELVGQKEKKKRKTVVVRDNRRMSTLRENSFVSSFYISV